MVSSASAKASARTERGRWITISHSVLTRRDSSRSSRPIPTAPRGRGREVGSHALERLGAYPFIPDLPHGIEGQPQDAGTPRPRQREGEPGEREGPVPPAPDPSRGAERLPPDLGPLRRRPVLGQDGQD